MKILGISFDVYPSSAAIIANNKVIAACAEERLIRRKYSKDFPKESIKFVLRQANCDLEDIDCIAIGWNPAYHILNYNSRFSEVNRWRGEQLTSIPNNLSGFLKSNLFNIDQKINNNVIQYVDHHLSHAGLYYLSDFPKATIVTVDGTGENQTITVNIGHNKIEHLYSQLYPHSLGLFYGTLTQFLGFCRDRDEWKVMALASYHEGENSYIEKMDSLIKLTECGFELDLSFFNFYLHDQKYWFSDKLVKLLGNKREKEEKIKNCHIQIANALQCVFEKTLNHIIDKSVEKTGIKNVVLSGGCFMNSVFNGKIKNDYNVYISPFPDDTGVSVGAGLIVNSNKIKMNNNYLGPSYSDDYVEDLLKKCKIKHKKIENKSHLAAKLLEEDYIIGWHQGAMEFGQRALGNRSILANPTKLHNREKINSVVKEREWFRPLAATCLYEKVYLYFENSSNSFFMEKVFKVVKNKIKLIPAVVHVDGTSRVQSLKKEMNENFYMLIEEFYKLSNIPMVLNTSFNSGKEPIVCSPEESLQMFFTSAMDILFIENFIITKNDISF